jgi:hypothetical protein
MKKVNIPKNLLIQKIEEELTIAQLADFFKCSKTTIIRRKHDYNIINYFNHLSDFEKEQIKILYSTGISISNIAIKLNITESTISSFILNSIENKKCPYCDYRASSWKKVRPHTSHCSLSTKNYYISLIYGPILLESLYGKNYVEIRKMYSKLPSSELATISSYLNKVGYNTSIVWTRDSAKEAVLSWAKIKGKQPTSKDTEYNKNIPSSKWAQHHFGSWNNFIEYCGFTPNNSGFGTTIKYKDGNLLRSNLEFHFVDNHLYGKYDYIYEKDYPGNTHRICDFYLPEWDVYIEIAGGLRPEVIEEKIQYCKENNLNLLVLYPRTVYSKNFDLQAELENILKD